jgi:CheY-like chemotaxis protein
MAMTIAVVTDLIFSTKITGTAKALGKLYVVARTLEKLGEQLDLATEPPLVIVDLNSAGVDGVEAVRRAKGHRSGARVVAFLSHVEVELAQAAREAGADQVMARSGFVERLPGLLQTT